jgi:hypothetical protein
MRLTYEEFRTLTMQYVFGINAEEYCARRYINEQFGIVKEVATPRKTPGDHYSGFGDPVVCFYIGDGQTYTTARELYEGEFLTPWFHYKHGSSEDWLPFRPGWYEACWTDTYSGMTWWSGECWYTNESMSHLVAVTKWRGMADVKSNPTSTESNA